MKLITLLLLALLTFASLAQRTPNKLSIKGTMMGYEHDPDQGIFNKNQKIDIQGSISGVAISVLSNGKEVKSTKSKTGGDFSLSLDIGSKYTMEYSKKGYGVSAVFIDLRDVPEKIKEKGLILDHLEFILNDFESDQPIDNGKPFGTIYFDKNSGEFKFKAVEFEEKKGLFKKEADDTPLNLITNSIAKNKENNVIFDDGGNTNAINNNGSNKNNNSNTNNSSEEETPLSNISSVSELSKQKIASFKSFNALTKQDLTSRENEIREAWNQLEEDKKVAVTEEDFLLIKAREELLIAAEKELDAAKSFIKEQEDKIAAQSKIIYLFIGLALLLALIGLLLFRNMKAKQKTNAILAAKNKKINDSILYAERIQKSVLISDEQINSMLPNAFVYYKPLDIVSGDFYWFAETGNKVIFAAIDCTGHGVPGAFMSLIGNTLLNQIVKEKKISEPAKILSALHTGVVDALHHSGNEDLSDDGMDMALCSLDKSSLKLTFSGAMNPVYIVSEGEVNEVSGNLQNIGGTVRNKVKREYNFTEETVQLKKGDAVYLFSDGFMDQFGGEINEKFNIGRFKELLLKINTLQPADQKKELENRFTEWRGEAKQIDDVLVVGTRV